MKTILVYDDEFEILSLYEKILRTSGYKIVTKQSAVSVDDDLRYEQPHLVITDVVMDEKDGFEVMASVKKISPSTKTLVISGGGNLLSQGQCLEAARMLRADKTLAKPIDVDEFSEAVESLIGNMDNANCNIG